MVLKLWGYLDVKIHKSKLRYEHHLEIKNLKFMVEDVYIGVRFVGFFIVRGG